MIKQVAMVLVAGSLMLGQAALAETLVVGPSRIAQPIAGRDSIEVIVDVTLQDRSAEWADRMWGTDEGFRLTRHVGTLTIRWAKSEVFVPLSAYADLGQPESVEFVRVGKGASFVIRGGETSTGYSAQFFVEKGILVRRRVSLGEFKDEVWEETRYSGPVRDN